MSITYAAVNNAALLLLPLASIRADEPPAAANPAKLWDALWRFETHG